MNIAFNRLVNKYVQNTATSTTAANNNNPVITIGSKASKSSTEIFNKRPAVLELLIKLKTGLGAVKLPPQVKSVTLSIASEQAKSTTTNKSNSKINKSSGNVDFFWREFLPKLAYNNKSVSFNVSITKDSCSKWIVNEKNSVEIPRDASYETIMRLLGSTCLDFK